MREGVREAKERRKWWYTCLLVVSLSHTHSNTHIHTSKHAQLEMYKSMMDCLLAKCFLPPSHTHTLTHTHINTHSSRCTSR